MPRRNRTPCTYIYINKIRVASNIHTNIPLTLIRVVKFTFTPVLAYNSNT